MSCASSVLWRADHESARVAVGLIQPALRRFADPTTLELSNRCEGEACLSLVSDGSATGITAQGAKQVKGWCAMSVESKPAANASVGELMSQLSAQTSRLVRDEMRLAQKEFQESAKHAGIGAGLFSVAGLLAFLGLATVIAAAVAALSLVLEVWAAALIVGAVLFVAAGVAALIGRNQVGEVTPAAPRTVETVKEDIKELKGARHDDT